MMMKVLMKRETTILNLIQDHLQDIMNMKNISQEEIIWTHNMSLKIRTVTYKGVTTIIIKENLWETKDIMKMIKVNHTILELQEDIKITEITIKIQEIREEAQPTELIRIIFKMGKKEDTQGKDMNDLQRIIYLFSNINSSINY